MAERTSGDRDPVAIVGAACRLPGTVGPDEFWQLLRDERDIVGAIPAERFNISSWHDLYSRTVAGMVSWTGGYLDDIDTFDADFFRMSGREAACFDPQHRILLETTWEALDDAGIPSDSLAGSRTGVYTNSSASGYWDLLRRAGVRDLYAALGSAPVTVAAHQISYQLDLRGPSMSIDATCASSLLATQLACQAIWRGDIDLALVGSAQLLVTPDLQVAVSNAGLLSSTGRVRFGDRRADGYVRSEGAVAVVLKPLRAALADGDRVYAAILGGSVTNDGRTGGTAVGPGVEAQQDMLRLAYRDAGVTPSDIDYVEAHGTGTAVGDRVELTALSTVMADGHSRPRPCLIGSVKTNIGHLEGPAGLTGLLKVALALRHRTVPASLHVTELNPILLRSGTPVRLAARTQPWPVSSRPAMAGVSAFGLSGTNTHLVLAEATPAPARTATPPRRPEAYLLPLSARSPAALRAAAGRYATALSGASASALHDVCYSAGARRTHHDHRLAVWGTCRAHLVTTLRAFSEGQAADTMIEGCPVTEPPRVVFAFPDPDTCGRPAARQSAGINPGFVSRLDECRQAVHNHRRAGGNHIQSTVDGSRAELWAFQVALAAVWRSWGIEPDLCIGQGTGVLAAATVAGAVSVPGGASMACGCTMPVQRQETNSAWSLTPAAIAAPTDRWVPAPDQMAPFAAAARTAMAGPAATLFIEISPHPTVTPVIQRIADATGAPATAVASLRYDQPALMSLWSALGTAYVQGATPDWTQVHAGGRYAPLPLYPWQRKRFWVDVPSVHAKDVPSQRTEAIPDQTRGRVSAQVV